MNINNNRQNAHNEIDRVFKVLLPARNMAERPAQVALSHQMLDAMLDGGIALCDSKTTSLIQRYMTTAEKIPQKRSLSEVFTTF